MFSFHDEFAHSPDQRYLNHTAAIPGKKRAAAVVRHFAEADVKPGVRHCSDWIGAEQRLCERQSLLLTTASTEDIARVKNA
jgi:hypothetical protein